MYISLIWWVLVLKKKIETITYIYDPTLCHSNNDPAVDGNPIRSDWIGITLDINTLSLLIILPDYLEDFDGKEKENGTSEPLHTFSIDQHGMQTSV